MTARANQSQLDAELALATNAANGCRVSSEAIVNLYHDGLMKTVGAIRGTGYEPEDIMQYFWLCMFNTRLLKFKGTSPLHYFLRIELRSRYRDLLISARAQSRIPAEMLCSTESIVDDDGGYTHSRANHLDTPANVYEAFIELQSLTKMRLVE